MSATATMTESSMPIPIPVSISAALTTPSPSTSPVPFSTSSPSPPLLLSRTVLEWPTPDPAAASKPGLPALLQLSLTAPGPRAAVFKFKTNAPNLYRVKPSAGTVAPGTSLIVLVQCADMSQMRVHTDNLLLQMCFDLSPPNAPAVTSQAAADLIRSLSRTQLVEQVLSCAIRRPSAPLSLSRATSPVGGASPTGLRVPSPVMSTVELRRSSFSSIHEHPIDAAALEMRSLSPSPSRLPSPPPFTGTVAPSSPPSSSASPPLRTKPRQRRTSTTTGSPILRTTLLSNATSPPPAAAPRSLSPGAWPARRASTSSTLSPSRATSTATPASYLPMAPMLAPGQLRATPLAWLLRTLQHVVNKLLGNLLTMTLGTFILAGIALTRGSTWLVGVLLAPVCRVAGRVQSGFKVMGKVAPAGKAGVARAMNGSNRGGKVARMFPFGMFGRWARRTDLAAAISVVSAPEVLDDGERVVEHAVAL